MIDTLVFSITPDAAVREQKLSSFQPISKRVHGYLISPLGGHRFDGITLD
ncbi:hypothetical protein [Caballeronia glebae]|uniref:ABC transporter n=1 Tax=Caballeronia glebae TaxID=1777143 RepID=A0A158D3M7_9BURK|nr:hypothetical protein [Caballeronia glebae]SAK89093.1 ABC transporter [Caballeronia glebae]